MEIEELRGWCKACGEVRTLDREMGRCGDCGSPHVSSRRILLEEAA